MKSHLQVKVSTLAFEAHYIRSKEKKWKERAQAARAKQREHAEEKFLKRQEHAEANFWTLRGHRIGLRHEARHTHLAYGFMLGNDYSVMEEVAFEQPNWTKVENMVKRFGGDDQRDSMQKFSAWKTGAEQYWETSLSKWKEQAEQKALKRAAAPVVPRVQRTREEWEKMQNSA